MADNNTYNAVDEIDVSDDLSFTYDVRCFLGIFDLPTYPNQILYYISLFNKIRFSLTYLPKILTSYVNNSLEKKKSRLLKSEKSSSK